MSPDGRSWRIKDADQVDVSARLGRFDTAQADRIRRQADEIEHLLRRGERWWDAWAGWTPDPAWVAPANLPAGWDA
ncbi:MAG TPA: hypothetical protein VFI47_27300 [Acidimicrobiales bacterium]|nr:hypothetical protein [Acidimicrobiales bacterium]